MQARRQFIARTSLAVAAIASVSCREVKDPELEIKKVFEEFGGKEAPKRQRYPGWIGIGMVFPPNGKKARSAVMLKDDWSEGRKVEAIRRWAQAIRNGEHIVHGDDLLVTNESNRSEATAAGLDKDCLGETIDKDTVA